jgi:hypothetical protein
MRNYSLDEVIPELCVPPASNNSRNKLNTLQPYMDVATGVLYDMAGDVIADVLVSVLYCNPPPPPLE